MKNIDYLELFFKKHNLSGRITVKYSSPVVDDEYMSDIIFEDGCIININDVIFDIDSDFQNEIAQEWMKSIKSEYVCLFDWIKENIGNVHIKLDTTSIEEYQKEMTDVVDNVKKTIQSIFEFEPDEIDYGDSDIEKEVE